MVSSTAANVSMPTAFSSEPPSNARRSGMLSMIFMSVVACRVVVAARDDVALHLAVEVDELGCGHEVERGDDLRPPQQRLHLLGQRAVRRQHRVELGAVASPGGSPSTRRSCRRGRRRSTSRWRAPRRRSPRARPPRRRRPRWLFAGVMLATRSPHFSPQLVDDGLGLGPLARPGQHLVSHVGEPGRQALPAGPVAPNTPIFTAVILPRTRRAPGNRRVSPKSPQRADRRPS